MPGGKVFLNYRRDDSEGYTGRIYDRLNARFPGRIFRDVVGLQPGEDFVDALQREGVSCEVLVAIIGRRWLAITDAAGHRRLDNPDDVLRQEIFNALKRNVLVIPLLVGGAVMPSAEDLPTDLAFLARRQALSISEVNFDVDIARLMQRLETALGETKPPPPEDRLPKDEVGNLLAEAHAAKQQQDWQGAARALRAALALAPTNAEIATQLHDAVQQQQVTELFQQGQQFYQTQDYKKALNCFREVRVLGGNYNDVDRLIAVVQESMRTAPKKRKKWRWIVGGAIAVVILISIIVSAVQDKERRDAASSWVDASTPSTDSSSTTPSTTDTQTPAAGDSSSQTSTTPDSSGSNSSPTDSGNTTPAPAPFDPTGNWSIQQVSNGQWLIKSYLLLRADGTYQLSDPQGADISDGNWSYASESQALNFSGTSSTGNRLWMMRVVGSGDGYIDVNDPTWGPMRMFRQ